MVFPCSSSSGPTEILSQERAIKETFLIKKLEKSINSIALYNTISTFSTSCHARLCVMKMGPEDMDMCIVQILASRGWMACSLMTLILQSVSHALQVPSGVPGCRQFDCKGCHQQGSVCGPRVEERGIFKTLTQAWAVCEPFGTIVNAKVSLF